MAPLSDVAAAALKSELSKTCNRRVLHAVHHRAKLLEYFVARGEGVLDLP